MTNSIHPPTVLITGASSGIGKAAAIYFARQGWRVAATMRQPDRDLELGSLPQVRLYALDVTDNASIHHAIESAIADFGRIDVLVNNAGFAVDGVFEAMSDEQIEQQFNTNVLGLMRVTRAIIPHLRDQGGGKIIQIASMGGRLTFPLYSIYHASKWAVEGFSESLQYELAPFQIQIKIVEPGVIKTEFYTSNRQFVGSENLPMYHHFVQQVAKVTQDAGKNGAAPEIVAHTIFRAATDRGDKIRYPVAFPANLLLPLRKILPDRWFFAIVRRSYRI
jgi:NAD(P)-dependent dehydrogenase (short-subunit alcohol dehydrogenase family)